MKAAKITLPLLIVSISSSHARAEMIRNDSIGNDPAREKQCASLIKWPHTRSVPFEIDSTYLARSRSANREVTFIALENADTVQLVQCYVNPSTGKFGWGTMMGDVDRRIWRLINPEKSKPALETREEPSRSPIVPEVSEPVSILTPGCISPVLLKHVEPTIGSDDIKAAKANGDAAFIQILAGGHATADIVIDEGGRADTNFLYFALRDPPSLRSDRLEAILSGNLLLWRWWPPAGCPGSAIRAMIPSIIGLEPDPQYPVYAVAHVSYSFSANGDGYVVTSTASLGAAQDCRTMQLMSGPYHGAIMAVLGCVKVDGNRKR
jgi:hypothetical protein